MNDLALPERLQGLPNWSFGDNPEMADKLLALVLEGKKTATCGALWQYTTRGEQVSEVGTREILLAGNGQPRCVIEITEARIIPFNAVDAEFARDEGEGDLTYAWWRTQHETFFRRQGAFSEDMPVVCLRFRLVENLELQECVQ